MKPPLLTIDVPVDAAPFIWNALEAAGVRGIQGIWQLEEEGNYSIVVVSIKQNHPGHARQAGLIAAAGYMREKLWSWTTI